MLPVAMPLQMRAMKSQVRSGANPSTAIPIAEAAMLHSSTGRRPIRSDRRPQIGMNRNCITENTAPGSVATKSPAPRLRARPGRNGITSPNPSRSRKIVRNSVPSDARAQRSRRRRRRLDRNAHGRNPPQGIARLSAARARRHQVPDARRSAALANWYCQ